MRKIETKRDLELKEKKKNRQKIWISVGMMLILAFSYLGYAIMDRESTSSKEVNYFGVKFIQDNGFWKIKNSNYYFNNLPSEINISIESNLSFSDYSGQVLYLVNYTSEGQLLISNVQQNLERYQLACLDEFCDESLPVKNCAENFIIVYQDSEENKVYQRDKCIFIVGDASLGSDAFFYRLIGMI